MDKRIEYEKDEGIIPPSEEELMAMQGMDGGGAPALGATPMDAEINASAAEPPKDKGVI